MPTPMRYLCAPSLAVIIMALLPAALNAQDTAEAGAPWRMLLQQQIMSAKACDLLEVLTYNELDLGDHKALEGRVSCIDGREFNFTRPRPHQKFEFNLCEPSVC